MRQSEGKLIMTNDQARERWRADGTPCVADGHRWQEDGEWSVCRVCGKLCPRLPEAPIPVPHH